MILSCPSCAARLKLTKPPAPDKKYINCPRCGQAIAVPAGDPPGPPPAPSPRASVPPAARKPAPPRERPDREAEEWEESGVTLRPRKKKAKPRRAPWVVPVGLLGAVVVAGGIVYAVTKRQEEEPGNAPVPPPGYIAATPGRPGMAMSAVRQAQPPQATRVAEVGTVAGAAPAPPLDQWLQDFEEAKRQAAKEKKDVFVAFLGSDWDEDSKRLKEEVFDDPAFRSDLAKHYVPVLVDSPRLPAAQSRVKDPARNAKLKSRFYVRRLPVLMYLDAQGLPYAAWGGYEGGAAYHYLQVLEQNWERGRKRDRMREKIDKAFEEGKLAFATELYEYLRQARVHYFYNDWVAEWVKLADKYDANNQKGFAEVLFEAQWLMQLRGVGRAAEEDEYKDDDSPEPAAGAKKGLPEGVARFEQWKAKHPLRDPNVSIRLYRIAAYLTNKAGLKYETVHYLRTAAKLKPTEKDLQKWVASLKKALLATSTGTGFVVAPGGYILTNHHVVEDALQGGFDVLVRVPGTALKVGIRAKVIASDEEHDLALIQVPASANPPPAVPLSGRRQVGRGEPVSAFGYPLGERLGASVKMTVGIISSTPEEVNKNMIGFDAQVTHGNSGGPLCDEFGNAVGVVSAGRGVSEAYSLNLARPAWDVDVFLKRWLPGYKRLKPRAKKLSTRDVDALVSRSVLMIIVQPSKGEEKK